MHQQMMSNGKAINTTRTQMCNEGSIAQETHNNVVVPQRILQMTDETDSNGHQSNQPAEMVYIKEQEANFGMANSSVIGTYVRQYVRSVLFRKIKFIVGDDTMCYGGRLCKKVLSGVKSHCGIDITNGPQWWEKYKSIVRTTIDQHRSSCGVSVKVRFLGELPA